MANQRNVETYYGHNTRSRQHPDNYEGRGRAVSVLGAVLAATRRVTSGEFTRCDVYDQYGHSVTIVRVDRVVKLTYHYGHRFSR